jgi:hypothetical protein
MSKFSNFIAADGRRDAMIKHFNSYGVIRLYNVEDIISKVTAPEGSEDDVILAIAEPVAATRVPAGFVLSMDDTVYEFYDEDGVFLGWEVVAYAEEDSDWAMIRYGNDDSLWD